MTNIRPEAAGKSLEATLDLLHNVYRRNGQALVWFEGTRSISTRDGWKPMPSRPDYGGILNISGRAMIFDAKSCQGGTYYHDVKQRAHQLIAIWDAYEAGAVAGLLVCNVEAGRGYWLMPTGEWQVGQFVPRRLEFAREIPAHPDFVGGYMPDWLEVVR